MGKTRDSFFPAAEFDGQLLLFVFTAAFSDLRSHRRSLDCQKSISATEEEERGGSSGGRGFLFMTIVKP